MKSSSHRLNHNAGRAGFTLMELVVCSILLGVMLTSIVPTAKWISGTSRASEYRRTAQLELANLMERIAALPHSELNTDSVNRLRQQALESITLSEAELTVSVIPAGEGSTGKQVQLALTWEDDGGTRVVPVQLTAWFYARAEQSPSS